MDHENVPPTLGRRGYGGVPPSAHPRKRSGRGWMWMSLFLALLLGLTWYNPFGHSGMGITGTTSARSNLEELIIEDNQSAYKIAVIDVSGMITSMPISRGGVSMVTLFRKKLEAAAEDKQVKAVLLKVNSPGGEVLASDEIYEAVRSFQKETRKPVVTSMLGLAASGGYYIAAASQWIVANPLTITGSIGVIMQGYNYRALMDKVGVRPMVFKSGKFKNMLSGTKKMEDILPEEEEMVQQMVDQTFLRFKEVVEDGRAFSSEQNDDKGRKLAEDWESYADGRILTGEQAYEHGFVDELGNFEAAIERAKSLTGLGSANLITYEVPPNFSSLFRLLGEAPSGARVELDLGFDMPRLQSGLPYFLYLP